MMAVVVAVVAAVVAAVIVSQKGITLFYQRILTKGLY
jgi:hypothetical protein